PTGEVGHQVGLRMNKGNAAMNRHALAVLDPQPNDHVLEVGMGNGLFVKNILLQDPSIRYTGFDYSELMIAEARMNNQVFGDRARFVLGNALEMPFEAQTFTKVFTVNTLYFYEDPAATLSEYRRVLQPDGALVLAIRPKQTMESLPVTQFSFTIYSRSDLEALLTTSGFRDLEVTVVHEPDTIIDGERYALESLVVKCRP
ncbi:MAG: class I SAM-dependent methyltransferase, partial [Bacteroidota bacterium]